MTEQSEPRGWVVRLGKYLRIPVCVGGVAPEDPLQPNVGLIEKAQAREEFKAPHFTCPVCARTSFNPNDIRYGYCGFCCEYTGTPEGRLRLAVLQREREVSDGA